MSLRYKVYSAYFDDRPENFGKQIRCHAWPLRQFFRKLILELTSFLVSNKQNPKDKIYGYIRVNTILPAKLNSSEVYCHFLVNGKFSKHRAMNVIPNLEAEDTNFVSTYVICALSSEDFNVSTRPSDVGITYEAEEQAKSLTNLVEIR